MKGRYIIMKNLFVKTNKCKERKAIVDAINDKKLRELYEELAQTEAGSEYYIRLLKQIKLIEDSMVVTKPTKKQWLTAEKATVLSGVLTAGVTVLTTLAVLGYESEGNIVGGTARKLVDKGIGGKY